MRAPIVVVELFGLGRPAPPGKTHRQATEREWGDSIAMALRTPLVGPEQRGAIG